MPSPTIDQVLSSVETVTGRVTMYRLVLSCLAGLSLVALVGSLFGVIPYAPTALVISLVVVVAASYAANHVISALFGVVPHSESSLITGLLLFFIFPPSTHLLSVLALALAALLANASKYILAVRGRHVFNPAAAGAFLLTLTGLSYSAWWAGNPVMLPFSAAVALLILRRTKRLQMGLVFVLVSVGIMFVRSLAGGINPTAAAEWPLTSSPVLFFAGLMLSEPLTQPPARWQQLTFAGLIGFLFSVPMHLGTVYIAPESALLIGNGLAFLFGQRRSIELVLQRRSELTPTTSEFAFRPNHRLTFKPGQYLELTLPHKAPDSRGLRRVFSIASSPGESQLVRIGTKVPKGASSFKQALDRLPEGSVVSATSIAGDFLLPRKTRTPLLLVAGGIGITPFASQLAELPPNHGRDIVVLYSVASSEEVSYTAALARSGARVVLVSRGEITGLPENWTWVPGSRIDGDVIQEQVPDIARRHVMVSGPPAMVEGVGSAARALHAAKVKTDYFSGY